MNVTSLKLVNYRNYASEELTLSPGLTLLTGKNAQGKTNLLESLFFCATGRSHRTKRERDLIRENEDSALISVSVKKGEWTDTIDIRLSRAKPREIKINGKKIARYGEMMGKLNCVLFAPEDLQLVKDGPSVRRRFADMELSQIYPNYFYALQRYNLALKQRNILLRQARQVSRLKEAMYGFDVQIAKHGAYIMNMRDEFIARLSAIATKSHGVISAGSEMLSAVYVKNIAASGAVDEGHYLNVLGEAYEEDVRRGQTTRGVHKDDIAIFINERDSRVFGSQGQQRTAAVSLKLSEIELMRELTGQNPVLLLDDVLSELDSLRQGHLIKYFSHVQTIVTATSVPDGFSGARIITVDDGRLIF